VSGTTVFFHDRTDHVIVARRLTASMTVERPTISGNDRFWYLGGAPSIDGYYVQTLLTADPRTTVEQPYWSHAFQRHMRATQPDSILHRSEERTSPVSASTCAPGQVLP